MVRGKIDPAVSEPHGKRRGPEPATPERLERAARRYLERHASSAETLRRVLMRRVQRSARFHGTDPKDGTRTVNGLIARYRRAGLLDDAAYAATRAAGLHRRGKSARAIRQALAVEGVAKDMVERALDDLRADIGGETDLAAAVNYARRRRIGPWRRAGREEEWEKDLAALGRQGFGYDIARRVIEAESPDLLEQALS